MSAPLANSRAADQYAQKLCLLTMFDVAPVTKTDRKARLGYASRLLGYPVESMALGKMKAREFDALREELLNLKDCPEAAEEAFAESVVLQPMTPAEINERVAEIEEELRTLSQEIIRLQWLVAERLAELWGLAKSAGFRPLVELTRFARIVGLKLATAHKWVRCHELIDQPTRDRHPDLSWSTIEVAANAGFDADCPATKEAVAHRLEDASDLELTGPGLMAHVLAERPKKPRQRGDVILRETFRENMSPAAFAEADAVLPIVHAKLTVAARKVAP